MLCVLFVATRMRALQLNPEGNPQEYVQLAMQVRTQSQPTLRSFWQRAPIQKRQGNHILADLTTISVDFRAF